MKKRILITIFVLLLLQSKVSGTLAQTPETTIKVSPTATPIIPPANPINLTLSPVTIQLEAKPGEVENSEIKIRNNGTEDEPLKVSFGTFAFNERTQQLDLNQEVDGEYLKWISVDQPQFTVRPGEWKNIKLTFSPPKEASLTYYYAVIFSRIDQKTPADATTKVSGSPAVLVLTNVVSPLAKRELQVASFSVPTFWVEFLPQSFDLKIKNSGNVHLAPTGNIFIDGPGKKDLAVLSVNSKNSLVLPNSTRDFSVDWNDGFPRWVSKTEKDVEVKDEKGNVVKELDWADLDLKRFRIGKYTAHLLLVYDNGERDVPIESYISFWVIPWRILLVVVVLSVLVIMGLILLYIVIKKVLPKKEPVKTI